MKSYNPKKIILIGTMISLVIAATVLVTGTVRIQGSRGSSFDGQVNVTGNLQVKGGSPWVDVKAFGAKCDNVTDDSRAIQAAIDSLPIYGGEVRFPNGICILTTSLNISDDDYLGATNPLKYKRVKIVGSSMPVESGNDRNRLGTILKRLSTGDIFRINMRSTHVGYNKLYDGFYIQNLGFESNSNYNVTAINGYRSRIYARDVSFKGITRGIFLDNTGDMGADYSDWNVFDNLRFHSCYSGVGIQIRGVEAPSVNGIYITNSNFSYGLKLSTVRGGTINNIAMGVGNSIANPIYLEYSNGVNIMGLHIEYCPRSIVLQSSSGIKISGFEFYSNVSTSQFRILNTQNVDIENGLIQAKGGYDLHLFSMDAGINFKNVITKDFSGNLRSINTSVVGYPWGYIASNKSLIPLGSYFINYRNGTGRMFTVDRNANVNINGNLSVSQIGIGVGTGTPSTYLDVVGDNMRLRNSGCNSRTCNQGEMCWNATKMCVCTATNTRKCATLS